MNSLPSVTPFPIPTLGPAKPGSIIIFGGTFDPAHIGHAALPAKVRQQAETSGLIETANGPTWIVYVPAARSPHKPDNPIASDDDRVEMLRLAIAESPNTAVWTDEIDRARATDQPSYSVDTLQRARSWLDEHSLAGVPLRLLMGQDQALTFHRWLRPRDILRLAKPLVMMRPGVAPSGGAGTNTDAFVRQLESLGFYDPHELAMWRSAIVPIGEVNISATRVRAALRDGTDDEILRFLPPAVLEYIRMRSLYRSRDSS